MQDCIIYKNHAISDKRTVPPAWVKISNVLFNPNTRLRIGFSPVENERDYYIPDSVEVIGRQEFIQFGLECHQINPFTATDQMSDADFGDRSGEALSDAEVSAELGSIYDAYSEIQ